MSMLDHRRIPHVPSDPSIAVAHHPAAVPGRTLEPAVRTEMEQRFGTDFSGVRVHTDASAGQAARGLRARAYTVGQDVFFGPGWYAPDTAAGRRLLMHELTHTVQQRGTGAGRGDAARVSRTGDPAEREAVAVANGASTAISQQQQGIGRQDVAGEDEERQPFRLRPPEFRLGWSPRQGGLLPSPGRLRLGPPSPSPAGAPAPSVTPAPSPAAVPHQGIPPTAPAAVPSPFTPAPASPSTSPWTGSTAPQAPSPWPQQPRAGTPGDVLQVAMRLQAVQRMLDGLTEPALRDLRRTTTADKVVLGVGAAALTAPVGLALAERPDLRRFALDRLNGVTIPLGWIGSVLPVGDTRVDLRLDSNFLGRLPPRLLSGLSVRLLTRPPAEARAPEGTVAPGFQLILDLNQVLGGLREAR